MIYHYGYCNKSGYGFIKDIYDKYNIDKNINIINYEKILKVNGFSIIKSRLYKK